MYWRLGKKGKSWIPIELFSYHLNVTDPHIQFRFGGRKELNMWTCEPRWIDDCLFTGKRLILISTWISILTFVCNTTELWITQTLPLRVPTFLSEAGERRIAPGISKAWGEVEREWARWGRGSPPPPGFLFFVFARSFVPFSCFFGNACYAYAS